MLKLQITCEHNFSFIIVSVELAFCIVFHVSLHFIMSLSESFLKKIEISFNDISKAIQQQSSLLKDPLDRIFLIVWLKTLRSYQAKEVICAEQLRIEYARYLLNLIEADKSIKRFPFNQKSPPENTQLKSLLQLLADHLIQLNMLQNQVGPLYPIISRKSEDGRAIIAVKRSPEDETLLCYLSVSRDI